MKIAVDIDDTLTDSFAYFQPFVAEYFGVSLESLRRRNLSYSNLPDEWKADELGFCRTYYDRFAADTPFKKDAAWGVRTLRERGHKILILTGRTKAFYTDPCKTTTEELEKGGIVYDKLICTLDKGTACREEKIDLLIDDLPANCDAAAGLGIRAILFASPANKGTAANYPTAADWQEVIKMVDGMEAERRVFGKPENGEEKRRMKTIGSNRIIRPAAEADLPRIMALYDRGRAFMRAHGNAAQWINGYPSSELVKSDICRGVCFVCCIDGKIHGVFALIAGDDPTYRIIEEGDWLNHERYGALHRLAVSGEVPGVGSDCMQYALRVCRNVRVDTHADNMPMQNMLKKNGFVLCGVIHTDDGTPRLAFQGVLPA